MASSAKRLAVELRVLGDDDMVAVEKIEKQSNYTKSKTLTGVLCRYLFLPGDRSLAIQFVTRFPLYEYEVRSSLKK
jgi:hypothetical protein